MIGRQAGVVRSRLRLLAVAIALVAGDPAAWPPNVEAAGLTDEASCVDIEAPVLQVPTGAEWAREPVDARARPVAVALCQVLDVRPDDPWSIRLHVDLDSLLRVNPLAAEVGGVVGGSRRSRDRADVVIPARPDDEASWDATVRYEVGRMLVLRRAGARLPDVWVDATADYLAGRSADRAAGVARLRTAWSEGRLPTWTAVSASDGSYIDPPVVRPMALSALHFLTERYGFEQWLETLDAVAKGQPLETAVQSVMGATMDSLGAEWRSWLPGYLDGRWQAHALYDPDLAQFRGLVEEGRATLAVQRLALALPLVGLDEPAAARAVESLLSKARTAEAQAAALTDGMAALADGNYTRAESLAAAVADDAAAQAGRRRLAREVTDRARAGRKAIDRAHAAAAMPPWRALEARAMASSAAADLERIGNDAEARGALTTVEAANRRLRPVGVAMVAVGLGALVRNAGRRRRSRVLV